MDSTPHSDNPDLDTLRRAVDEAHYRLNEACARTRPATPEYRARLKTGIQRAAAAYRTALAQWREEHPDG